jgi:hypothetical protein
MTLDLCLVQNLTEKVKPLTQEWSGMGWLYRDVCKQSGKSWGSWEAWNTQFDFSIRGKL